KPRARIFQDFYILNNGSIELEQQILFKNMGSEEFYAYPLYDLFDSYKSCSDEKYYRLDLTPITVNKSQTPRFVRRIMVLPANGENGFLIKCKANFNIERLEDNKNAFSYKTSSWNKTGDGIEVEKFEKRIYLPKHKFLDLMDVDFFTSPPKTPSENEDNYIFIYQEEFIHDKDTYVIRIVYEYKYNLKRIIVWLVLTLLTIWIGKISFKKIKYYVVHKIFKKENKPPPDKSSGSLRNTIPENM
ncbi:MAG TPA: hypothetical protein VJJ75_01875, partial [Candidatus Nanoarchaeia archaeon]|nr:hypothetical protein [Candidatus Nanoarchaeia archaeon]